MIFMNLIDSRLCQNKNEVPEKEPRYFLVEHLQVRAFNP